MEIILYTKAPSLEPNRRVAVAVHVYMDVELILIAPKRVATRTGSPLLA
jgi:hypothetical protein